MWDADNVYITIPESWKISAQWLWLGKGHRYLRSEIENRVTFKPFTATFSVNASGDWYRNVANVILEAVTPNPSKTRRLGGHSPYHESNFEWEFWEAVESVRVLEE